VSNGYYPYSYSSNTSTASYWSEGATWLYVSLIQLSLHKFLEKQYSPPTYLVSEGKSELGL
jgi:hypothetical protein